MTVLRVGVHRYPHRYASSRAERFSGSAAPAGELESEFCQCQRMILRCGWRRPRAFVQPLAGSSRLRASCGTMRHVVAGLRAHQRGREQALGDVHAELAIGLELFLVEELVECGLVREIRIERRGSA